SKYISKIFSLFFSHSPPPPPDFRAGLESGIVLCELLNAIKPGAVKKINRLPTPIAGLDNIALFLRGCEELGLKGSQLFDPGDLQDTTNKSSINCPSYSGPTLNLKEFEGLLSLIHKETEDTDSPKRSIRDSGYIDCWDSERSDSLSPPRHARDDSFDSLDSFGSRSQQTPSPEVILKGSSDGRGSDSESDVPQKAPDVKRDDMSLRRASYHEPKANLPFNQYLPNKSNQTAYMPAPLRKKRAERGDHYRKSWSNATSPVGGERPFRYSPTAALSDDAGSVSMNDMRPEDDTLVEPHSKARHEEIRNIHNRLREEQDKWQDDLARWKSRRRSASQDLIKRKEEREFVEKIMSGEQNLSDRRKSIKTYKEIVEEKERRENELQEEYKKARNPEEAQAILKRYSQRFIISEAVLESLQLPKCLERSQSVDSDSSSSPTKDTNVLKYLRQQSLPAQKYTATVEAMIIPPSQSQLNFSTGLTSPTRTVASKAVPMLTPKPYSQPKDSQTVLKSFKVDGKIKMNGETSPTFTRVEGKECTSVVSALSLTKSQMFEGVTQVDCHPLISQTDDGKRSWTSSNPKLRESAQAFSALPSTTPSPSSPPIPAPTHPFLHIFEHVSPSSLITTITHMKPTTCSLDPIPTPLLTSQLHLLAALLTDIVNLSLSSGTVPTPLKNTVIIPILKKPFLDPSLFPNYCPISDLPFLSEIPVAPLNIPKCFERWSWDPEEERKRQERWQKEQERLLQERYRREQEKLRQEWEKAQKEVEEEERRYHEEVSKRSDVKLWHDVPWSILKSFSSETKSVSGKKLCSTCRLPLGKGAAMIIETLSLYFHIQCFKCGICQGQLGDATTGTDVRIRNGLLNCHECYIRSRSE
uniref:LIM and calponin homology domains 1 n=1 Tax=Callorhinchus milii TaxID=7868 RepID=A0A4W3IKI5_CALMI